MATIGGISAGAAYNKLEKTDDGIAKTLEYYSGLEAQGQEGDKNRAAKKAADDADRKERKDVRDEKDYDATKYNFDITSPLYSNLDQANAVASKKAAKQYGGLRMQYSDAQSKGDRRRMHELENEMLQISTAFKDQQDAMAQHIPTYQKFDEMDKNHALSPISGQKWRAVQGMAMGELNSTYPDWDEDKKVFKYISNQADENGVVKQVEVSSYDINQGIINPVGIVDLNSKDGLLNRYSSQMGTFKNSSYNPRINKDISDEGRTKYAKDNMKSYINNDLKIDQIKDLANRFFPDEYPNEDGLVANSVKLNQARNKVADELFKQVMISEDTAHTEKVNLEEPKFEEEKRHNKATEEKAVAKKDEVIQMAERVSYDAEQAMNGDISGMSGVIITAPDKKTKKTSTGVTDLGQEFVVKFDDGTTQRVPKTKQGIVNFIAQSDNLASGRDKGLVETAIREKGVAYDRPVRNMSIGAGFSEGLKAIKKSGTGNDDKASKIMQSSLPAGWKVENANNGLFNNEIKIVSPDGKEITVDYDNDVSKAQAQAEVDRWEQSHDGNSSSVPTTDADALINKYK